MIIMIIEEFILKGKSSTVDEGSGPEEDDGEELHGSKSSCGASA